MHRYTLDLLGLNVTFRTDADEERIQAARKLLEDRFAELGGGNGGDGAHISKEKLLTCLALSLADDLILSEARLTQLDARISRLLERSIQGREDGHTLGST